VEAWGPWFQVYLDFRHDVLAAATHWDQVTFRTIPIEVSCARGILDDWPATSSEPRSPKYLFGKNDPIVVTAWDLQTDPTEAEQHDILVTSSDGGSAILTLQEASQCDRWFYPCGDEFLVLSESDYESPLFSQQPDAITVIDEPFLTFYIRMQPDSGNWVSVHKVMVDRAESRTEYQATYASKCGVVCGTLDVLSDWFAKWFYTNMNEEPIYGGIIWWPLVRQADDVMANLSSHPANWSDHGADATWDPRSVDLVSWSGHSSGHGSNLHFFVENDAPQGPDYVCSHLPRGDINVCGGDADWVIFDTCWFLKGTAEELKADLLVGIARAPHMFLGYDDSNVMTYWRNYYCGHLFKEYLREPGTSIKQAFWAYSDDWQFKGCIAKVFAPADCMEESLAGPGPIRVEPDPTALSNWDIDTHPNEDGDPPPGP